MQREQALEKLRGVGHTFTTKEARAAGLHWEDLYALRDAGELIELSRGVFRMKDAEPTPYVDLIAVSKRVPKGAICLTSALWFWDLTDEMPSKVDVAVPRGSARPRIVHPSTRVHLFDPETFELGRETVELDSSETIHIYSAERTVIDAMRMRHRVGSDVALQALRRYLARRGSTPGRLLELARRLRAEEPVAAALEILVT